MKKHIPIFLIVIAIAVIFAFLYESSDKTGKKSQVTPNSTAHYKTAEIKLKEARFKALVSDTPLLRSRGLSGFAGLKEGEAMLFVFDAPEKYGFWMKDMLFPIDIVWLDEGKRVVHVESNVLPETYPSIFFPESPALYVLELPAGIAARIGVAKGDKADFQSGK